MKVQFIIIMLGLFILSSNAYASPHKNLDLKDLQCAQYTIDGIGEGGPLQHLYLSDYKQSDPKATFVEKVYLCNYAFGDINGDGLGDAVAVIALNTGGTGNFTFLTALLNDHGKVNCIDWVSLGDRTRCKSLEIKHQKIICDAMTHASSDGACFPTLHRVLTYKLVKNKLIGPHNVQ